MKDVRKFISYQEAVEDYDENALIIHLQEGSVKARGRYHSLYPLDTHPEDGTPITPGLPEYIPMTWWRDEADLLVRGEDTDLVNNQHDLMAYVQVEIERSTIPVETPVAAVGAEVVSVPNKGGRPKIYDWEKIGAAARAFLTRDKLPETYAEWINTLLDKLPVFTAMKDGPPSDKHLRTMLKPIYDELKR